MAPSLDQNMFRQGFFLSHWAAHLEGPDIAEVLFFVEKLVECMPCLFPTMDSRARIDVKELPPLAWHAILNRSKLFV